MAATNSTPPTTLSHHFGAEVRLSGLTLLFFIASKFRSSEAILPGYPLFPLADDDQLGIRKIQLPTLVALALMRICLRAAQPPHIRETGNFPLNLL
jgi:hypothetical protein